MEGIFDKNRTWMKVVAVILTFMLSFSMWSIPAYAAEGSGSGYASAQIGFFGGEDETNADAVEADSADADTYATDNDNGIVPFAVTYADADYAIHVGETCTIDKGTFYLQNEWSQASSDGGEVSIDKSESGQTPKVTGVTPGLVTLTHKGLMFSETFTVLVKPAKVTASFDLNGGNGTTPDAIGPEEVDTTITLPTGEGITRDGYTFIGWSVDQNANPANPESGTIVGEDEK